MVRTREAMRNPTNCMVAIRKFVTAFSAMLRVLIPEA
jgi:hypothetical protein